jgi:hypothetical protein
MTTTDTGWQVVPRRLDTHWFERRVLALLAERDLTNSELAHLVMLDSTHFGEPPISDVRRAVARLREQGKITAVQPRTYREWRWHVVPDQGQTG